MALDILSLSAFGCLDWEFMIFEWLAAQAHALEFTITNCFSNATHSLSYIVTYETHLGNACFNSFSWGSPQWVFSRTLGAKYFWMVKKNMSLINSPNSISRNVAIKDCTPYLKIFGDPWHLQMLYDNRMSLPWRTCCCCCCRPVLQKISLQKQPHKAKPDWYFSGVYSSSVLLWRRQLLGTRKGCLATWHSSKRI